MTELERQLTVALKRLSAQYEREQQRHSKQVEALRRRVERLSGQVTRLTEYYGLRSRSVALPMVVASARDYGTLAKVPE